MSQLFVNIKNERFYKLVDFARRKSPDGTWKTEIAYQPEQSNQIYVREVTDFFSKFVPHNCWETANEKQRQDMKNTLGLAEDKPISPKPVPHNPIEPQSLDINKKPPNRPKL